MIDLLADLQNSANGLTLSEMLERHPDLPRRTAQRWVHRLLETRQIRAEREGRQLRYFPVVLLARSPLPDRDAYHAFIPVAADSEDIVAYIDQPPQARKPVGYQRDFLDVYQPNVDFYLPQALRRRLHRMGKTTQAEAPAGTYSRAILNRLLIDLSWASSQLEGNTYSRIDTRELIEHGKVAKGKEAIETQMILNHKAAIELLVSNIDQAGFDRYTLLNLHGTLAENLLPNRADEGRVRQHPVGISKSVYQPLSTPQQIDETLDVLLDKALRIEDPFEQSFFAMVHIPYLQPFADVNKRTSRLAANIPLFRANLCPLTFLGVPEYAYNRAILGVYEMTRVELLRDLYAWAYERSTQEYLAIRQNLAEPDPIRLVWRDVIKQAVRDLVLHPEGDTDSLMEPLLANVPATEREDVKSMIIDELAHLHEGVLARYGLRPSQFAVWKTAPRTS